MDAPDGRTWILFVRVSDDTEAVFLVHDGAEWSYGPVCPGVAPKDVWMASDGSLYLAATVEGNTGVLLRYTP